MRQGLFFFGIIVVLISLACAFQSNDLTLGLKSQRVNSKHSMRVYGAGDLFDDFKKFWEGNDSDNNKKGGLTDSDDEEAGALLIASIPVKQIKPGGLRLFLMFYCMGMQNTPDRNSWRADQPSSEEYVVDMLYHDASGSLTIELFDDEIRITRCGSVPSTAYLMQESVIVNGILDELHQCAFDESVEVGDRLLIPEPLDAIDLARGSLSFS